MMQPLAKIAGACLLLCMGSARADALEAEGPKGVNPKDLVTKVDVIYKMDRLEGGARMESLTLKYDQPLDANWGVALELPVARFASPGVRRQGVAESKMKLRYVHNAGRVAWIAGAEFALPTQTDDALGSGKWQVAPLVGAVVSTTPTFFVFGGYQHFFSVAGPDRFTRINQAQPRLLAALTSPQGWWIMGDFKYTHDRVRRTETADFEVEAGRMFGKDWALSVRAGVSGLDSARRTGTVLALRRLF